MKKTSTMLRYAAKLVLTAGLFAVMNFGTAFAEVPSFIYEIPELAVHFPGFAAAPAAETEAAETEAAAEAKEVIFPIVFIRTNQKIGNRLEKPMGYVDAKVSVIDEYAVSEVKNQDAKIKVRGNSTALAPKKPYTIKFETKTDVYGMGAAKKWNLLANCYDPTLFRNSLALKLAKDMGLAYTGEQKLVEVYMDNRMLGLYLLTEAVEAGKTRVDIDTDAGDFLLECESERVESDVTYLWAGNEMRFALKEPEEPGDAQLKNIQSCIDTKLAAMNSADYATVKKHFDVDSFAKYLVLNQLFKSVDFCYSSTYFYQKDGKLYAGPAWDYDISAGNVNPEINEYYEMAASPEGFYMMNAWYTGLLNYYEFCDLVAETYEKYAPQIEAMIADGGGLDQLYANCADEVKDNYGRVGWKVGTPYSNGQRVPDPTYEENVAFLKNWLRERHAWLKGAWTTESVTNNEGVELLKHR